MTDPNDDLLELTIPADLAVAAAEECRQSLLADLARDARPVRIGFSGDERLGIAALQLALAAAAAARAANRPAQFAEGARAALTGLGLEG